MMNIKKLQKNTLKTYEFLCNFVKVLPIFYLRNQLFLSNHIKNIPENPCKKFIKNPLKNPLVPSILNIFLAQSIEFAYKTSVRP